VIVTDKRLLTLALQIRAILIHHTHVIQLVPA
jgi:hypothetical protein